MQTTQTSVCDQTTHSLADMLAEAVHENSDMKNRRSQERYPYTARIRLRRQDDGGQYHTLAEVCSTDVSTHGMGMLSKVPLPLGRIVWLEFKSGTPKVWRIQAKIVYCRPLFADVYRVGVAFVRG